MTGGGDALLQRSVLLSGDTADSYNSIELAPTEKVDLPHAGMIPTQLNLYILGAFFHSWWALFCCSIIGTGCVRYRSDGRIIVSTHWDGSVRVFDQKRLKPLAILRYVSHGLCS